MRQNWRLTVLNFISIIHEPIIYRGSSKDNLDGFFTRDFVQSELSWALFLYFENLQETMKSEHLIIHPFMTECKDDHLWIVNLVIEPTADFQKQAPLVIENLLKAYNPPLVIHRIGDATHHRFYRIKSRGFHVSNVFFGDFRDFEEETLRILLLKAKS